jgi:hypothetical protein
MLGGECGYDREREASLINVALASHREWDLSLNGGG